MAIFSSNLHKPAVLYNCLKDINYQGKGSVQD